MKFVTIPLILFTQFAIFEVNAQQDIPDPDSILVGDRQLPQVLLVGAFHFAYYNLDAHVTREEDQVNVMLPQRQAEMQELVEHISKFKPNKIMVESGPNTGYLLDRYRNYKNGKRPLASDEIEQIGFRILEKFELDTMYGTDDITLVWDLYNSPDSLLLRPILDSIYTDWDFSSDDALSQKYDALYEYDDKLALKNTLLDQFRFMNSVKMYERTHGAYLCGDFELGDTRGADALAMHWYSRNLRIFRHIQQATTSPDDRILVLYGAGHMGILYHLFKCSPQYRLVNFNDL